MQVESYALELGGQVSIEIVSMSSAFPTGEYPAMLFNERARVASNRLVPKTCERVKNRRESGF